MRKMRGLDLFSGIGGITQALAPWVQPVAYCENDRYAQSVLLSRMGDGKLPIAPIWDDIRTLRGTAFNTTVDIIYGGFPCQDISLAGLGAGLEGERSGLFFEIVRLIDELHPTFVFLENVPAIRTRGAERVGKLLAGRGYDSRWDVISAAEIGAPHLRKRWFIISYANGERLSEPGIKPATASSHRGSEGLPSKRCIQNEIWKKSPSYICGMDDGISPKTHRIKGLGNAVVPQQAREAFQRLMGFKGE